MSATESHLSLARLGTTDATECAQLEGAVSGWLHDLEDSKWPWALQHFENAAFLQGNHIARFYYSGQGFGVFVGLGAGGGQTSANAPAALQARCADNQLIRPVEQAIGMLTQARPAGRASPGTDAPEDEDAAAISEALLPVLYKRVDLGSKLAAAAHLACLAGTAIAETDYGPSHIVPAPADPVLEGEPEPNPDLDPDDAEGQEFAVAAEGAGEPGEEEYAWQNDFQLRIWSPWHIVVDPSATDDTNMAWIARTTFEDVDWIVDNYTAPAKGDAGGRLYDDPDALRTAVATCENVTRKPLYWYTRLADLLETPSYHNAGLAPAAWRTGTSPGPNMTSFTVIDIAPTWQFPRGRTLVRAGTSLIYDGPARAWSKKYPRRWHPYSFFRWFKMEGKFFGVALLTFLVPLQKKINAIDYLVQINRESMSLGQWTIPRQCKVPEGYITHIPNQHIYYTDTGNAKPERVQNTPLTSDLTVEREQLIRSIDFIAAASVVGTENISASAARAGSIFNFLREEKLRSKAPMLQAYEGFIGGISRNLLIDAQLAAPDDTMLARLITSVAREHSAFGLEAFLTADLVDNASVKIDVASDLMRSPEADSANALQYFQAAGGQVTPEERSSIWQATGLQKFSKNLEDASVRRARRMIASIRRGRFDAFVPLEGIDRAAAMAQVFQRELLSERWLTDPEDVRALLTEAYFVYAQAAAAEAAQAMRALAAQTTAQGKPASGDAAAANAAQAAQPA